MTACPPIKGPVCPVGADPAPNGKIDWPGDLFSFGPAQAATPAAVTAAMPPANLELEQKEPGAADKLKKRPYRSVSVAEALQRSGAEPTPPKGSKP